MTTTAIVTIQSASDITGLAVKTLYNLRSLGEGPKSFLLRRRVRYYEADIHEWIAAEAGRSNVTSISKARSA